MITGLIDDADEMLAALGVAGRAGVDDEELIAALRVQAAVERAAQRAMVDTVAELQRRGVFAERGQRPVTALSDLLGCEQFEARRVVVAADQVVPRVDLQGQVLPARLPATAAAFTAGAASLRHVQVVARLMKGATAEHLTPEVRTGAEEQIAAHTGDYTPTELRTWGAQLLDLLDQDGAEPDDREPAETNELFLTRHPDGSGGRIKGRIDNAAMFEVFAALLDAKSAPLTKDDTRPLGRRQAEAMAEIFSYAADHGDTDILPATGGRRPHVNVLIRLEDLENRARAACLDFAGIATPTALRMLCCDACAMPNLLHYSRDYGRPRQDYRWSDTCGAGFRLLRAAVLEPLDTRVGEDRDAARGQRRHDHPPRRHRRAVPGRRPVGVEVQCPSPRLRETARASAVGRLAGHRRVARGPLVPAAA